MKITLSKSQWEKIGKKAGWMKKAQTQGSDSLKQQIDHLRSQYGKVRFEIEFAGGLTYSNNIPALYAYFKRPGSVKPNARLLVEEFDDMGNPMKASEIKSILSSVGLNPSLADWLEKEEASGHISGEFEGTRA